MPLLVFLFFVAAVVWALALTRVKLPLAQLQRFSLLQFLGLMVIQVGSVLGHDFFHVSVITFDRLLLGGVVVLAGGAWLLNKEDLRTPNLMDVSIFVLIGFIIFSTFTHNYRFAKGLAVSRLLFFYLLPLALYMVVRTAKLNRFDLAAITTSLGLLAVYLAITGVAEIKQINAVVFPRYIVESIDTEFFGRGRGPFLNPVSNGIFQLAGFCCIWFWWPRSNKRLQLVILGVAAVVVIGIYATLTRSCWLTLAVVVGIGLWLTTDQAQKGGLLIAGIIAGVLLFPVIGDKIFKFKRDKAVSVEDMSDSAKLRPLFFKVAMRMFADRPVFGCGFGQYAREKSPYLQDSYSGEPLRKTRTFLQHNVFLAYLTELGGIGLGLLLTMLGVMARSAWMLWLNQKQTLERRQFGLLLIAVILGFSINGMFHDTAIMPMVNYLLFFVAGIVNNIVTSPAPIVELTPAEFTRAPRHPLSRHGSPATG